LPSYAIFFAARLHVCVSRSKNLNPFGALDVTGEAILGLLTIQSQRRKLRHATFFNLGGDEVMPSARQALSHSTLKLFKRCYDTVWRYPGAARYGRQIGLTGRG